MRDESAAIAGVVRALDGEAQLDELAGRLARARLVLLGEATHGTREFYDLRAGLTRRLLARHGFAAVAVEGDWPDALRVDRFVRGQGGDDARATEALGQFTRFPRWMWRNREVVSLAMWMRRINAERPPERRAGFYGLDVYALHASSRTVLAYLDEVDPASSARARHRYACFDHVFDPEAFGPSTTLGLTRDCEEEVVAQLAETHGRHAARSGRMPSGDAWFHAMQEAHVVRDAEAYYRAMFGGRGQSWNLRGAHMAETLDLLATQLGAGGGAPAKLVVWAHNSHVGDARATELGRDGQCTLGQLVRQRHPGESALVGFTTYEGHVIAAEDWDAPHVRTKVGPALAGSWEALFHATALPRFIASTEALAGVVGADAERLQRAIGVVYRPETERASHYLRAHLVQQFDHVIHVDRTSAVEPLDRVDGVDGVDGVDTVPG